MRRGGNSTEFFDRKVSVFYLKGDFVGEIPASFREYYSDWQVPSYSDGIFCVVERVNGKGGAPIF